MNLLKLVTKISGITILSRILGFVRDLIISRYFGIGILTDAFFLAFKLANLLKKIFAEGAFSQSFIPVLMDYKKSNNYKNIRNFISYIFGVLFLFLAIITIFNLSLTPNIVNLIAPGYSNKLAQFNLTVTLTRIMFPYIILVSISSFMGSILNSWNKFFILSISSIVSNVNTIFFIIIFSTIFGKSIMLLPWSILFGALLQLIYQLPFLNEIKMLVIPKINFFDKGVHKVCKLMIPATIGFVINQMSLILNTILSSFLIKGSISWIYYADRLIEFPISILSANLSSILLPILSAEISNNNFLQYSKILNSSIRIVFLTIAPSSIILGFMAKPLIMIFFQHGNFSYFDTLMISKSLIFYSFGLLGLILSRVISLGFYVNKDIKTTVKINIIILMIIQSINLILIQTLSHTVFAFSISVSSYIQSFLLYFKLCRKKIFIPGKGWFLFFIKLIISLCVMAGFLVLSVRFMPRFEDISFIFKVLLLLFNIVFSIVIYSFCNKQLGLNINKYFLIKN